MLIIMIATLAIIYKSNKFKFWILLVKNTTYLLKEGILKTILVSTSPKSGLLLIISISS